MYRKFYELSRLPFKVTPELDFFFSHAGRELTLETLFYSIDRGDPIIKVVGESGTGKTMLSRILMSRLKDAGLNLIYIASPNISFKGMLFYICRELEIQTNGEEDKFEIIEMINICLLQLHSEKKRVIMLIDEAQAVPVDTLEEIRLLSNLETSEDKLLQIVFFAQLEFDKILNSHLLKQLKNRISYAINIKALSKKETKDYLNYRMNCAGYEGREVFSQKVANIIHNITHGVPREINFLADKLLMSAYDEGHVLILPKYFLKIGVPLFYLYRGWVLPLASIVFIIVIALVGYYAFKNNQTNSSPETARISYLNKNYATGSVPALDFNALVKSLKSNNKNSKKHLLSFYQDTLQRLPVLFEYKYTLQLMRGNLLQVNKAYAIFAQNFNETQLRKLFVILVLQPNLTDSEYIFVYNYSNVRTTLYSVANNMPNPIKKSNPFLVTSDKIRKIIGGNISVLDNI